MAEHKKRVILVGNPGVGKSTILNTVIGSVQFRSGISVGTGLTTVLQEHETDDCIYADTPGLEDVRTRKKAGKEISTALRRGGNIKLIFIMTVESGRLRPSDITTMEHILGAITEVGIDVSRKFAVVINKMTRRVLSAVLRETDLEIFVTQVCQKYHAGFVDVLLEDDTVKDEDDAMFSNSERAKAIIQGAPYIVIEKGAEITVNTKRYEDMLEEMEGKMQKLREDAAEREKVMKSMEERHAGDMERLRGSIQQQQLEIQARHERQIHEVRMALESQKQEMQAGYERDMEEMVLSTATQKQEMQARYDRDVQAMREASAMQQQKMQASYEREMKAVRNAVESQKKELQAASAARNPRPPPAVSVRGKKGSKSEDFLTGVGIGTTGMGMGALAAKAGAAAALGCTIQ